MQWTKEKALKYKEQLMRELHEAERNLNEHKPGAPMPIEAEFLGQREDQDGVVWHRVQRPWGEIWEIPADYNPGPKTPKSAWDNALCSLDVRVHQKIVDLIENEPVGLEPLMLEAIDLLLKERGTCLKEVLSIGSQQEN